MKWILFLLLSVGLHGSDWRPWVIFPRETSFRGIVRHEAALAGVDPALLMGLVAQESQFDPGARSYAGAVGLAQLMPSTALWACPDVFHRASLYDPRKNVRCGARYLSWQLRDFGDVRTALVAYHDGPNRTRNAILYGLPATPDGAAYARKVITYARLYRINGFR